MYTQRPPDDEGGGHTMHRDKVPSHMYHKICTYQRDVTTLYSRTIDRVQARIGLFHWAIPLFNYTPLQMTINGVQGGIGNMSRGGCHLNPCPGGLEGIIEACPGESGTT